MTFRSFQIINKVHYFNRQSVGKPTFIGLTSVNNKKAINLIKKFLVESLRVVIKTPINFGLLQNSYHFTGNDEHATSTGRKIEILIASIIIFLLFRFTSPIENLNEIFLRRRTF